MISLLENIADIERSALFDELAQKLRRGEGPKPAGIWQNKYLVFWTTARETTAEMVPVKDGTRFGKLLKAHR
jgi:hypothetical protein